MDKCQVIENIEELDLLEILGKGKKIQLQKGDVLIFELSKDIRFPEAVYGEIYTKVKDLFPDNKCVVLNHLEFKAMLRKKE